nr:hypothetical protein [Tanacetum cinerariifolium]
LFNLQTAKKKSPTDRYILQKRSKEQTESSGREESLSLYAELGLSDSGTESDEINPAVIRSEYQEEDQARSDPGRQAEGQAGPNPGVIPGSQPLNTPGVLAGPNPEHPEAEVGDSS